MCKSLCIFYGHHACNSLTLVLELNFELFCGLVRPMLFTKSALAPNRLLLLLVLNSAVCS